MNWTYHLGVDENGLGARLGPLLVTAVLARAEKGAENTLSEPLPACFIGDIGDSKQLVSHADCRLGEAWARVLIGPDLECPGELVQRVSLVAPEELKSQCPPHISAQCWTLEGESFRASTETLRRVESHRATLRCRGIEILAVCASVVCTRSLNLGRKCGQNRFVMDLHQMEQLVLKMRELIDSDLKAVCGKVGGIGDYPRFFGPLGGRPHRVLEQTRPRSGYRFPGLGEIYFVQDADSLDLLVMVASLMGKYLRELLMARIARYYEGSLPVALGPSGYHDPITTQFVLATRDLRRQWGVPQACFERQRPESRAPAPQFI